MHCRKERRRKTEANKMHHYSAAYFFLGSFGKMDSQMLARTTSLCNGLRDGGEGLLPGIIAGQPPPDTHNIAAEANATLPKSLQMLSLPFQSSLKFEMWH